MCDHYRGHLFSLSTIEGINQRESKRQSQRERARERERERERERDVRRGERSLRGGMIDNDDVHT